MNVSTEKEAAGKEEADDRPPGILHNAWFWFWQVILWIGYTIITLLYVPWALAMHVVLAVLAIPLSPALCSQLGRKVFIYTYVVTVMMPGKYIWFNAFIRTKRRGRIWDYEMGKPRAVPPNRRRLSHDAQTEGSKPQAKSQFLSKLPPELRLQIYREVFVGGSSHLHIMTRRTRESRTSPPDIKVRGYLCNRRHSEEKHAACGCMVGAHAHHDPPHASEVQLPMHYGNGRIAILQTCRKVYAEAIDLMYSAPTFCFNNLEQPPFFILSSLPSRLSRIQNIQLCWKQITMSRPQPPGSSLARYIHRVGQCTFCNLTAWLKLIQKHMTGLRSLEVFLYLDKKMPVPQMGQSWIVDLLKLQTGPGGVLRKMQVKVYCNNDDLGMQLQSDYKKAANEFTKRLRKEIKKNQGRKPPTSALVEPKTMIGGKPETTMAAPPRAVSYNGGQSSVLSNEEGSVDGSGVIGPLRSVSDDD